MANDSRATVVASNPRPTDTGTRRGVDIDVSVTLPDGRVIDGEVTLCPAEDGRPVYESWGPSADFWVSGKLLQELFSVEAYRDTLDAIESAASDVAGHP
jgi:hypothetical protein